MALPGEGGGRGALGMQRIRRDHQSLPRQGLGQDRQGGDLPGLRGELVLAGDDPTTGEGREQMRGSLVLGSCSAQGLPVDSDDHAVLPSRGVTGQ